MVQVVWPIILWMEHRECPSCGGKHIRKKNDAGNKWNQLNYNVTPSFLGFKSLLSWFGFPRSIFRNDKCSLTGQRSWYDMIWYDMIRHIYCVISVSNSDMIWYDKSIFITHTYALDWHTYVLYVLYGVSSMLL